MTWLSHSGVPSTRMKGILPRGEACSTASSVEPVRTVSSVNGTPFSSSTIFTLL
jgi:hypothetical protein